MKRIFDLLKNEEKIKTINAALQSGEQVNLSNVKSGLKGFLALLIFDKQKKNQLFLTATDREARRRAEVLQRFSDTEVLYYPLEEVHSYFSDAHSQNNAHQRMRVLEKIFDPEPRIIVASVDAVLKKLLPKAEMTGRFRHFSVGEGYELGELSETLVALGFERVYQAESPGQFAVRGGIVDIAPVTEEEGIRLEFWGDEIESIRRFNLANQISTTEVQSVKLSPAREVTLDKQTRQKVLKQIKKNYQNDPKYEEVVEKYSLAPTEYDEAFFAFLSQGDSLLDYLDESLVLCDEFSQLREQAEVYTKKVWDDYESLVQGGFILPEEKNKILSFSRLERELNKRPTVRMSLFHNRGKKGLSKDMNSRDLESFAGRFNLFVRFITDRLNKDYSVFIQCKSQESQKRIKEALAEADIFRFTDAGPGIHLSLEEISEGFELADEKIIYINESEIFAEAKPRRRRTKIKGKKIDSFTELHVGDYVVHDIHGIGVYQGIEQLTIDGLTKDLMVIEYAGEDKLYIPIEQMGAVQVYVGTGGERRPKVNKIGNPDWQKTKSRAKKAVEDMADELIELYAKRRAAKGYAFSPDSSWQQEFEDDFPHVETDDQLRSVEEIKADMEAEIPMDRLLCGDVGYGKTEVALRAAFKAISDGKQVAILVPTTILAQQHYATCLSRFKKYPVTVEVISRFRTPTQQKKILGDLAVGKVDLIIGTHRLLSQDVKFKDLGLLIIDEEQRFGVRSKEKIKGLRENIDVLTLSATPIPRTLHMSMTGIRDMSVLEEPPAGRRPVQTYVMAYSPPIVKDAIERELARHGQVYFVHNRVKDIHEIASTIEALVPDARIAVAHGQMSPTELENIMVDFLDYRYDILVTTTIIESGLDVKNANTLIVDNGDHFGLSQLYQIRGRVGRSDVQAYAYVTHRREYLSEVAQKRLKAIKDFTAFGSGFKVAMRDLEIRGAGNILGSEQSGHLFSIGYELYCRILEETIQAKLSGKTTADKAELIHINLDVDAYIPESYIPGEEMKYDIYKKLTYIKDTADYDALEDELIDRFGDIPDGVYHLMSIAMIKNMALAAGVVDIKQNRNIIYLTFKDEGAVVMPSGENLPAVVSLYDVRFNAGRGEKPRWRIDIKDAVDKVLLDQLVKFFSLLN